MQLAGRTAVVTGAASGIGRAIAVSLARRGCNLALADIDEAGMAATAEMIQGVRVSRHRLDVANRVAVAEFPDVVAAEHGGVDVLVTMRASQLGVRSNRFQRKTSIGSSRSTFGASCA
jgi:NAD(P)-dependent dehydrogenase (short-subunit alcohol dehydrogenase family)